MVEGGRLESDYTLTGIGGSNPLSSVFLYGRVFMRKIFLSLVIFLVLAVVSIEIYSYFNNSERPKELKATFACERGKKIDVVFYFADKPMADVTLSDGRSYLLSQGMSASGARYVNPGESFVLWIKGDTAFIEENGKRTFDGCVVRQK